MDIDSFNSYPYRINKYRMLFKRDIMYHLAELYVKINLFKNSIKLEWGLIYYKQQFQGANI